MHKFHLDMLVWKILQCLQNYYGLAIRRKKGNFKGMKNAAIAILYHFVKDETVSLK